MFCPKCGKGDQTPDSYCRSCGEFLTDYSAKAFLLSKLLGGSSPRTQIKVNIVINFVTVFVSSLLLGFLKGHYDALRERRGELPPRVISYVYIFLGLVMTWQFLGFLINFRLLKKLADSKKAAPPPGPPPAGPPAGETELSSRPTQRTLHPGDPDRGGGAESVTQQTTKKLDKIPRR